MSLRATPKTILRANFPPALICWTVLIIFIAIIASIGRLFSIGLAISYRVGK